MFGASSQDKLRREPERRPTLKPGGVLLLRCPSASWPTHSSGFVRRLTKHPVFSVLPPRKQGLLPGRAAHLKAASI